MRTKDKRIWWAIAGAIGYCIPAAIFLATSDQFSAFYLLYIGNFIFLALVCTAIISHNRARKRPESLRSLFRFGSGITMAGAGLCCIAVTILLLSGAGSNGLLNAPAQMVPNVKRSLIGSAYFSAGIINITLGMFASLLIGASLRSSVKSGIDQ